MTDKTSAPASPPAATPAPAPAAAPEYLVALVGMKRGFGGWTHAGQVFKAPDDWSTLVNAGEARIATAADLKIAGIA